MSTTPDERRDAETHPSAPHEPPPPPTTPTETFETPAREPARPAEPVPAGEPTASSEPIPVREPITEREPTRPVPPTPPPADLSGGTGAHAAPRPYPPSAPPPPGPAPVAIPTPAPTSTPAPGPFVTSDRHDTAVMATADPDRDGRPGDQGDQAAADHSTTVPAPVPASVAEAATPLPERPAKPGFGRHLLATVLGLVLTPFALLLVGIGTSGLAEIAGKEDVSADILSLSLLLAGVAVLAAVVLLGAWSPAMPIAGGLVWGIALGVAYLVMPNRMADSAESLTSDGSVPESIEQLADAAMSGYLLVLGILLVAAGIAAGVARRTGRRWAEAVALADRARAAAGPTPAEAGEPATRRTRRRR